MNKKTKFSEFIDNSAAELGLSYEKLAIEIGVSLPTLTSWRTGRRKKIHNLNKCKIINYFMSKFGVSKDFMLQMLKENENS